MEQETGEFFTISQIKELLKIQESTIKSFLTVLVESTNTRIDNLVKDVQAIKTSLELSQAEITDLKKSNCEPRLKALECNIETLIEKADDLENRSRRNNLCFEGIEESFKNESWEESEDKVKSLIATKLNLNTENIVIERAHRVGRKRP